MSTPGEGRPQDDTPPEHAARRCAGPTVRGGQCPDVAVPGSVGRPARARRILRFLSQPYFVAEAFTGTRGK